MRNILAIAILCITIICNGEEVTVEWTFKPLTIDIDTAIIESTRPSSTIVQCTFFCSSLPVEKAVSFYFNQETTSCHCNSHLDQRPEGTTTALIQYGVRADFSEKLGFDAMNNIAALDCLDLYEDGYREDGLYRINSWDGNDTFVKCDMQNGGWTIIQKRFDGSVDFRQNYDTCRLGFGNVSGEYWIGLENMHKLTSSRSELEVTIESFPGNFPTIISAVYDNFVIGSAETGFTITVEGYSGNCGDSFNSVNGMKFSAPGVDNDLYQTGSCVDDNYGSFWYNYCGYASLNGRYFSTLVSRVEAIRWYSCSGYDSVKATEMKIRRV